MANSVDLHTGNLKHLYVLMNDILFSRALMYDEHYFFLLFIFFLYFVFLYLFFLKKFLDLGLFIKHSSLSPQIPRSNDATVNYVYFLFYFACYSDRLLSIGYFPPVSI